MASTSESGHIINVANLGVLNSSVASYGAIYNPSKASIKIAALLALETNAKNVINTVNNAETAFKNAGTARELVFDQLNPLVTKLSNALKATDASDKTNEDAKSLVRKIKGIRAAKKKNTTSQATEASAETIEPKTISSSQMSFDNRLNNFDKFIKLLASTPQYAPNETELKITTLTPLLNDMRAKNTAVVVAKTALTNAMISRNDLFYKEKTGLYDIAMDTKSYVKSLFGATSQQYKDISKIKFTKKR